MPDNNFTPEEQFTNQAWSEMQKLLDKELPVVPEKDNRRKAFIWWFLTGAAAAILVMYLFSFDTNSSMSIPIEALPVPQQQNTIANFPFTQQESIDSADSNHSISIEKDKLKSSTVKQQFKSPTLKKNPSTLTPNNRTQSIKQEERPIAFLPIDETISRQEQPLEENLFKKISPLASLSLDTLAYSSLSPSLAVDSSFAKIKKWNVGVIGGIHLPLGKLPNGFSGGLIANRKLHNPRWAIESGIVYSKITYTQDIASLYTFDLSQDIEINGLDTTVIGGEMHTLNVNEPITYILDYLSLPITVSWQAQTRWKVSGGLAIEYLLKKSINQSQLTSDAITSYQNNLRNLSTFSLEQNSVSLEDQIDVSKLNIVATTGIRYQATPALAVDLRCQLGLLNFSSDLNLKEETSDVFTTEVNKDTNKILYPLSKFSSANRLQLSLVYYLQR